MLRVVRGIVAAACLIAFGTSAVVAAIPDKTCPGGQSGFESYGVNPDWVLTDGVPGPGEDDWWDLTVAGFAAAGLTLEDATLFFGVETELDLYQLIHFGILGLDRNGDGAVCAKPFPEHQNGAPAFAFNAVDNNARQP